MLSVELMDDENTDYGPPITDPPTIRRSATSLRARHDDASNPSSDQPQTPPASDEQSLTSFPSLDPSLDNSPGLTRSPPIPLSPTSSAPPPTATPRRPLHAPAGFDALFNASDNDADRSALFDDTPKVARNVPGTLHLQDDKHVRHLVSRVGGVPLVKQLAADLAQRDAQVTLLQRRAEERESLLKKMLRECEVSNRDIEARLRTLDRDRATEIEAVASRDSSRRQSFGTRPEAALDDRMSEALSDELGSEGGPVFVGSVGSDAFLGDTSYGTIRPNQAQRSDTKKGNWTDYFKYRPGNAVKSSQSRTTLSRADTRQGDAGLAAQSRGLNSDMFRPPPARSTSNPASSPDVDIDETPRRNTTAGIDTNPIQSDSSATSWAMRLVGGSSQTSKDRKSAASGKHPVGSPNESAQTTLRRLRGGEGADRLTHKRGSAPSSTGPTGTARKPSPETIRKNTTNMLHSTSPPRSLNGALSNLGPVEMDSILPEGDLPPTLLQQYQNTQGSEYLTDTFGFIYDQRRRKRQHEAARALQKGKRGSTVETLDHSRRNHVNHADDDDLSIHSHLSLALSDPRPDTPVSMNDQGESQQPKRWQDYLKLSNFPTELLSHTPSVAPITDITTAEPVEDLPVTTPAIVTVSKPGSTPALSLNPPSATTAVSDNTDVTRSATSDPTSPAMELPPEDDPVKSLLSQLTEVHDASQRERTVKWNEFMRRVRADRRRRIGTNAENRSNRNSMPEVSMTDGEIVGIAGLGNTGKVGRDKYRELRTLVLSGIPVSYRAKLWSEGTGASTLRVPGYYDELRGKAHLVEDIVAQQIDMDITRTLTDNIFFRQGPGVGKLREILLAYAYRNPDIGYCQGMNLITANLLLIMPTAEDAFWILTSMIENILPEKYYDSSLLTSRADQIVLRRYVTDLLPTLSSHLESLGIELEAQTFQWFLSVFTDCLSAEALFRVWDVVLCLPDGAVFLFQVALALLKLNEKQLLACDNPAEVYGYVNQRMTDHAISIDGLIRASEGLKNVVKVDEVRKRRAEAVAREEETLRQRESIRKGKMKAVDVDGTAKEPPKPTASKAVDEIEKGRQEKITRSVSRAHETEMIDEFADMEVRTPLPVDEEALWRA